MPAKVETETFLRSVMKKLEAHSQVWVVLQLRNRFSKEASSGCLWISRWFRGPMELCYTWCFRLISFGRWLIFSWHFSTTNSTGSTCRMYPAIFSHLANGHKCSSQIWTWWNTWLDDCMFLWCIQHTIVSLPRWKWHLVLWRNFYIAASAALQPAEQKKRGRKPGAAAKAKAKAKAPSGKHVKAKAKALARSAVPNQAAEEQQAPAAGSAKGTKRKQRSVGTSEVAAGVEQHSPGKKCPKKDDEEQMKALKERKARISRKSAAYHRAMKQACLAGMTTEHAKIEGRKVIWL